MFKKRSRPASVREKVPDVQAIEREKPIASSSAEEHVDEDVGEDEEPSPGQTIEEMIILRKLRKSRQGIDLEKLNRGEEKKKRKADKEEDASAKYGLQATRARGNREDKDKDTDAKRLVRTDNFTQQTNALDVDKHMMAYIEAEMAKRRGEIAAAGGQVEEAYDPQAELYKLAEKYKSNVEAKKVQEEGSTTTALGMLSQIPEVDLGMENRLKNIEETEKAKREMLEQRKQEGARREDEVNFANARFFKPQRRQADISIQIEQAKREAKGLPTGQSKDYQDRAPRPEMATDEVVFERFKKRNRR